MLHDIKSFTYLQKDKIKSPINIESLTAVTWNRNVSKIIYKFFDTVSKCFPIGDVILNNLQFQWMSLFKQSYFGILQVETTPLIKMER